MFLSNIDLADSLLLYTTKNVIKLKGIYMRKQTDDNIPCVCRRKMVA